MLFEQSLGSRIDGEVVLFSKAANNYKCGIGKILNGLTNIEEKGGETWQCLKH